MRKLEKALEATVFHDGFDARYLRQEIGIFEYRTLCFINTSTDHLHLAGHLSAMDGESFELRTSELPYHIARKCFYTGHSNISV